MMKSDRHSILRMAHIVCSLLFVLTVMSTHGLAEVVRFEIIAREEFAVGEHYGDAGPYERIVGRVFYEIDPDTKQNAEIVDLKHAPRNARGKVEFSGDLFILTPKNAERGRRTILYDVNNRGKKLALGMFNDAGGNDPKSKADAGNGFLMRHGFTIVWSGWDGELLDDPTAMRMVCPVAKEGDRSIVGPVRCEIVVNGPATRTLVVPWANHGSYRPTENGLKNAALTVRTRPGDSRVLIPREEWKLHITELPGGSFAQLPKLEIEVPKGLVPGDIYELIYEGRDPLVQGVCFAGVRDLISAFRHGTGKNNPLLVRGKPFIQRAHGFGVSQSGRFLREFVYSGFNEDEQGRQVFDGIIPHVSGSGLGSFNHRFAQPTRHAGQHDHHDGVADRFPFTYGPMKDPYTGITDGILMKATASKTAPKVFHTQSAAEYWTRSGSLSHTDPKGETDAEIPANVRIYLFGGTQHGPGGYPPSKSQGQNADNPGDYKPFLRGLLLALDDWAAGKSDPPPSVYPTLAKGTLVDWRQEATGFPKIPGVRYPDVIQQPIYVDFGPRWQKERIIDKLPPEFIGNYRVLVPKCGEDGNELDCLSPPEVAVPLATFTGWNVRDKAYGAENELVTLKGSYIPFPALKDDRIAAHDPRPSLQERYAFLSAYERKLSAVIDQLRAARYLAPEDVERLEKRYRDRARPIFATLPQQ